MAEDTTQRRTFLANLLGWVCSLFLLGASVCGLRFLLDPLRTRASAGKKRQRIATLDSVPIGTPLRVVVVADRWDAYVHHPPGPIGAVWLTRDDADGKAPEIKCFQTVCPHLGCGIDYAVDRNAFSCPCHVSDFATDGSRRLGPSPRGMDELPVTITEPDSSGMRWVEIEYAEFSTGTAEKRQV